MTTIVPTHGREQTDADHARTDSRNDSNVQLCKPAMPKSRGGGMVSVLHVGRHSVNIYALCCFSAVNNLWEHPKLLAYIESLQP